MSTSSFSLRAYSPARYRKMILPVLVFMLLTALASASCGVHWWLLWKGFRSSLPSFSGLLVPDWSAFPQLWGPALESVFIALVGTFAGTVVSLGFGLAAASNIAAPWLRQSIRFLLGLERALPEIVILLFLVAAFGMGPFSGVLSLAIGSIGMLGKLFADVIEELDRGSIESIEAVGAVRMQVIWFGVLQPILPTIVSYALFRFELSIRLSILLGAVGAGGIGLELYQSFGLLDFHRAGSALLLILVMVFLAERGSEYIRKVVNGGGVLK